MGVNEETRLGYLDGLRGFAALWVLVGHIAHAFQVHIPLVSSPVLAVDMFMLLSGFLMYYHARLREEREPMAKFSSWLTFWTRRFFRLAPAYYVALAAAFALGPMILPSAQIVGTHHINFNYNAFLDQSWQNLLLHLTFLFGFLPEYAERTVVFDWSLALEMQFYLCFPLLFLCMQRFSPLITCALVLALAVAVRVGAGDYLAAFEQPAFLPMKINIFLAGMMIGAAFFHKDNEKSFSLVMAAMVLAALPLAYPFGAGSTIVRLACVTLLAGLALHHRYPLPAILKKSIARLNVFLGGWLSRFLGDASYAVYLIHPMILFPVCAYLVGAFGDDISSAILFLIGLALVTPITYAIAWALHHAIEKPGIAWGKNLTAALARKRLPA